MTPIKLYTRLPSGRYRPATQCEVRDSLASSNLDAARESIVGKSITSPSDAEPVLIEALRYQTAEVFAALWLDNRHRVLAFDELFTGTIDGTSIWPRECVKRALAVNACAVIIAHNHPSGVAEPSHADERITKRLRDAFDLVDIRLLDHIVVGDGTSTSLASRGLC